MNKLTVSKKNIIRDRRGANLVEYVILVGVVALIGLSAFKIFGTKMQGRVTEQGNTIDGINGAAP